MAYSFDLIELHKRAASNIDAILRGVNPGGHPFLPSHQVRVIYQSQRSKAVGDFGTSCTPC